MWVFIISSRGAPQSRAANPSEPSNGNQGSATPGPPGPLKTLGIRAEHTSCLVDVGPMPLNVGTFDPCEDRNGPPRWSSNFASHEDGMLLLLVPECGD